MTEQADTVTRRINGISRTIVSPAAWQDQLAGIRTAEKALTRAHDRLAAQRRQAGWVQIDNVYQFVGPDGAASLVDLFSGRSQLIVYHHMLRPADPDPCTGCCMFADQIPHLAHLQARNTSLVFVSKAPVAEIESIRRRMGWSVPWYESRDSFSVDFDVNGFAINVFYRDGDRVYRTYFTTGRGVESLGTVWTLLDLTPLGRQETWEDAPAGTPQTRAYEWWRRHDDYA